MKLYSAGYHGSHPFHSLSFIKDCVVVKTPEDLKDYGVLVIWGGEDISPTIYNRAVSNHTHATERLSHRDEMEVALALRAIELGFPIIGVCRGAQMLCGLAGGHLIQHVRKHGGQHAVDLYGGGKVVTNSIHHQMMYPFDVEHELRAWIAQPLSDVHIDVDEEGNEFNRDGMTIEPEYVFFPKIKGFAVQWHPEGMGLESEANRWLLNDLNKGIMECSK